MRSDLSHGIGSRQSGDIGPARHGQTVLIAGFPPPLNGVAKSSQAILEALERSGSRVRKLSVTTPILGHTKTLRYHIGRFWKCLAVLRSVILDIKPDDIVYIAPAAGLGLAYSAIHILAAITRAQFVYLHHHTYTYVETRSLIIRLLCYVAPKKKLRHVFLSDGMAKRFQEIYGRCENLVVTNAAVSAPPVNSEALSATPRTRGRLQIGYLSNLCEEKGFFVVRDFADHLFSSGLDAKLVIAGPILEPGVGAAIQDLKGAYHDRIEYLGPVFGERKAKFYADLDAFLFPTLFRQEAQPHVVYEALAAGLPVISLPRGCIPEMLADGIGYVAEDPQEFCELALAVVRELAAAPEDAQSRRRRIRTWFADHLERSQQDTAKLLAALGARQPPEWATFQAAKEM